jgi:cyclic-di-AMP phosphodiesterase PgpH
MPMATRSLADLRRLLGERMRAIAAAPFVAATLSATYAILVALAVIFTRSGAPGAPIRLSDFPEGGVAHRDVVADRDLQYVDEEATKLKVEAAERLTPPVFRVNDSITRLTLDRFDQFRDTFLQVFERERSIQTAFLQMQLAMPGSLTEQQIARLNSSPVIGEVLDRSRDVLESMLEQGILGLPESLQRDAGGATVEIWRWKSGKLERVEMPVSRVVTMAYLDEHIEAAARAVKLSRDGDSRELLRSLVGSFARENAFEDADETRRAVERARAAVVPEIGRLVKGQSIVRKGDIISEETLSRLRAIGAHRVTAGANTVLGAALFLGIVVALAVYLFGARRAGIVLTQPQIVFLSAAAVLYALWAMVAERLLAGSVGLPLSVFLPTAAIGMLVSIVLTPTVAIRFTVCLALILVVPSQLDLGAMLFALLSGLGGIAVVARAENRIDLIRAGLIISGLDLLPLVAIGFMQSAGGSWFVAAFAGGVANGFLCGVLALGFLPILDHALNTATRFRLMELSDVNAPILKRMLTLAPGTYSHSLAVANLAESACTAIGANHLLARVGAYYHDIGKIEQAEYFVENQTNENKHDELQPSLSVAVIKSHVKIGAERAKELSLPAEVVDIISQHHGRDLIKFFYHRARTSKDAGPISAGDYSYKGSRPQSREAAVVMLADAVEAATRTLKRPSPAKLEKAVWEIIMERFSSGELSESALTFRDLETIKVSFVHVLSGHFHTRIEYPKLAGSDA